MEKKQTANIKTTNTTKKTSWGGVSDWYDKLVESDDSYQTKVIRPNLLRFVGTIENVSVLDLACGQGYFSRLFKEQGAHVMGVDISKELIAYAIQKSGMRGVEYHVSPAHRLPFIESNSLDVVVSVLAFQNIENLPDVMKELARVLKDDGRIILVLNHPAFRIPQASDWGFDEKKNIQYRREDIYLSEKAITIDMNPGKRDSQKTVSFHRPLQYFFKMFNKYGFAVTRLEEWNSHKASQPGPRQKVEDKARKEFPLFMALEIRKA